MSENSKEGKVHHGDEEDPSLTFSDTGSLVTIGTHIGPYELLSVLGEGGFGMVYLAEQKKPVRRPVALKVIKPGMDSRQVIARFEAEEQALALLDHPHIAHVFDAGTTEGGRPYFVMEYVKGLPITAYCDHAKLTIDERLALFLQVCEGVQHAHQKGIIHRDVKPSNILVCEQGEKAIPKIIDFGVAKALSQPLTERTVFTEQGQLIGTPEYMSPEQAQMVVQDIDTRSDIYSLGVLLYELLTGVLPFDSRTLREGGIDCLRRMICEEDAKTPSTRLSGVSQEESVVLAQRRRTDVRSLVRALHGDLDWIAMKAMEKDRNHRYETTQALAEDVRRHLNNEPVHAAPPALTYRLRKFVRKHRTTLAAVAAIVAVTVTTGTTAFFMHRGKAHSDAKLREQTQRVAAAQEEAQVQEQRRQYDAARTLYYLGEFTECQTAVEPITASPHVGRQARLLKARLSLILNGPDAAAELLQKLVEGDDEVAGLGHLLLAQICLDRRSGNDRTDRQLERQAQEHMEVGERLVPKSAEAFLSRATIAGTIRERLQWLDKALVLDPRHYESYHARAVTYQLLHDYRSLEIDAVKMTTLRPKEPLGYRLAALAFQESSALEQAVRYCNEAIRLDPNDPDQHDLRHRIHMRAGDYEKALADARQCVSLSPGRTEYEFRVFCALVALRQFGQAKEIYGKVFAGRPNEKAFFNQRAAQYVFETLGRGGRLDLPEGDPNEPSFWIMRHTAQYFHHLRAKARPIGVTGFKVVWSPDGTRLAYSRGVPGCNAIEIYHIPSGKTELLTVPGKDPAWSPDGRYIAFVRERAFQSLASIAGTQETQEFNAAQEQVWIIKADGTEAPRYVAQGGMPSWSQDSKHLYFESRPPVNLCYIPIEAQEGQARVVAACPSYYPVVSPDEKYMAYGEHFADGRCALVVKDLHNPKSEVLRWQAPRRERGLIIQWAPSSREVSLGGFDGSDLGIWVYSLDTRTALQILDGPATSGAWSWDGGKMAFDLRPGLVCLGIWIAELKPGVSTCEALKPVRTLEEHYASLFDQYQAAVRANALDGGLSRRSADLCNNLWLTAQARYGKRAYEEAYDAVTKADVLYRGLYKESQALFVAYQAMTLHRLGRLPEAQTSLDQLRSLFWTDKNWRYWSTLGTAEQLFAGPGSQLHLLWEHAKAGRLDEACKVLEQLQVNPGDRHRDDVRIAAKTLTILCHDQALANEKKGLHANAIQHYRNAVRVDPNGVEARNGLAWLLATCSEAQFRNGPEAIEHATKACELTAWKNADYLDTLAAAHATAGDFELAVKRQKQAIDLLLPAERAQNLATFRARLQLYENKELYHGQSLFAPQLVAHWTFDRAEGKQTFDSSGNELHGQLQGDAHIVQDPIRGNVLCLDGDGDWVDCGEDARFDSPQQLTVAAWIKVGAFDIPWQTIVARGEYSWRLHRTNNSNALAFHCAGIVSSSKNAWSGWKQLGVEGTAGVNDGRWHHVAGVYDGKRIFLFVDGAIDNVETATGTINRNGQPVHIGGNPESPGRSWEGLIDDVRIYNYALSESDVKTLYQETLPQTP